MEKIYIVLDFFFILQMYFVMVSICFIVQRSSQPS